MRINNVAVITLPLFWPYTFVYVQLFVSGTRHCSFAGLHNGGHDVVYFHLIGSHVSLLWLRCGVA
jgi:hypothetical protein